jgi:hypothetical protein
LAQLYLFGKKLAVALNQSWAAEGVAVVDAGDKFKSLGGKRRTNADFSPRVLGGRKAALPPGEFNYMWTNLPSMNTIIASTTAAGTQEFFMAVWPFVIFALGITVAVAAAFFLVDTFEDLSDKLFHKEDDI